MASISVISAVAQFDGKRRLLTILREHLQSGKFSSFRFAVAFAKSQPLSKLLPDLKSFRSGGGKVRGLLGLSLKGTSVQALTLALKCLDETYVCFPGPLVTFHPKLYLFHGANEATAIIGSHNLTVGGTETNYEAGIQVQLGVPQDQPLLDQLLAEWDSLLPVNCPYTLKLDAGLLTRLDQGGLLFNEAVPGDRFGLSKLPKTAGPPKVKIFPIAFPKPASAFPPGAFAGAKTQSAKAKKPTAAKKASATPSAAISQEFVLQIVPHHNGEIFLSKIAVNQNPVFFGFPFLGKTSPKKTGNPTYPQRSPDPTVNIKVFDNTGSLVLAKPAYGLNTVFYQKKGEIRITVSPDILKTLQPYSIMHWRLGDATCDYFVDVFNPGSTRYTALLNACNQTLPSGGKTKARLMGWL